MTSKQDLEQLSNDAKVPEDEFHDVSKDGGFTVTETFGTQQTKHRQTY